VPNVVSISSVASAHNFFQSGFTIKF